MMKILVLLVSIVNFLFGMAVLNSSKTEDFMIEYFYDDTKQLTIDDVSKKNFQQTLPSQFSLGYIRGYAWYKITIENQSNYEDFVLYFSEPHFENMNFYSFENSNWEKRKGGLFIPLEERDIHDHNPAFYISLKPKEKRTYYLQSFNTMGSFGEFTIYEKTAFFEKYKFLYKSLYLLYFGGLFIIIVFNIFLYLKLNDKIFLYYTGYIFFFGTFIFLFSGISLYTEFQELHYELHSSVSLFVLFLILFSINYLEIEKYNKTLLKIFYFLGGFYFLLAIMILIDIEPWYEVLSATASIVFLMLSGSAIYVWNKGHEGAKYYILALSIYIISMSLLSSLANGWVENNDINRYSFLFGSYIEVIFFSLMLANRFYIIQKEKIHTQNELISLKTKNEQYLELEVQKRTDELLSVNKELSTALKDKELLLKELYHRVKNNFQMIISILWIESNKTKNKSLKRSFEDLNLRIKSMSKIHDVLYDSLNFSKIETNTYIHDIIDEIKKIFSEQKVTINQNIDKFDLDVMSALSLGVIINEATNNAIKHMDQEKHCIITVLLEKINNQVTLTISDNGNGFDIKKNYEGLGLKLIKQFANKLDNSKYSIDSKNGTLFKLEFTIQ